MVMHSKHISALIHQYTSTSEEVEEEDKYTDSIVLKGVRKVNLDYSIKAAQNAKASLPPSSGITSLKGKESTDHPWISRQEENSMLQSAAEAREWWENKHEERTTIDTMDSHSNDYSIYFKEEEMNVLNHLGQEIRGKVADRIRNFEGVDLSSTSSTGSTISSDDEEIDNGNHNDTQEERQQVDDGGVVEDTEVDESEVRVPEYVKSASQEARHKWRKMDEGISASNDMPVNSDFSIKNNSNCEQSSVVQQDTDPNMKWIMAQRMSEQLQLKKQQQSKKAED